MSRPFPHRLNKHLLIVFSWCFLVFAQSASLQHEVEHNYHHHQQMCDSFFSSDHQLHATRVVPIAVLRFVNVNNDVWSVQDRLSTAVVYFHSRAPPYSLLS